MSSTTIIHLTPRQHDLCFVFLRAPVLEPFNFTLTLGANPNLKIDTEGLAVLESCIDALALLGHPQRSIKALRRKVGAARQHRKRQNVSRCMGRVL